MNKQEASSTPELVRCPFCNAMTPPGAFCANCGRAIGNDDLAASDLPNADDDARRSNRRKRQVMTLLISNPCPLQKNPRTEENATDVGRRATGCKREARAEKC